MNKKINKQKLRNEPARRVAGCLCRSIESSQLLNRVQNFKSQKSEQHTSQVIDEIFFFLFINLTYAVATLENDSTRLSLVS